MHRKQITTSAIIASGVITGICWSYTPWQQALRYNREASSAKSRAIRAQRNLIDLKERKARVEEPGGLERLAREANYVKVDEVRVKTGTENGQ